MTTKRFLAKLFSRLIFENNGIDDRLEVYSVSEFQKPNRENLFSIDHPDFSPGFFTKSCMDFQELSKMEEVKEFIARV